MATRRTLRCLGPSLWPLVKSGQSIEIEERPEHLKSGDIIVYAGLGIQVCHRILHEKTDSGLKWFFMKGDGKLEADGWVPSYRVMGKVVSVDGKSVCTPSFRLYSSALYWHSKIQWGLYEILFLSPPAKALGRVLKAALPVGAASKAFAILSAPWLILKGVGRRPAVA